MIVCVEGADGCGKTTLALALAEALRCDCIQFPYDLSITGPLIRGYLRKEWGLLGEIDADRCGAIVHQALQVANRMEQMQRLHDARRTGSHLVLSRYWQSGWVYGQVDGLEAEWLQSLHHHMVQPDVAILIDVAPEICMSRRETRDGPATPERYEGRLDRTRKIVELYRKLWAEGSKMESRTRWFSIDGSGTAQATLVRGLETIRRARGQW